MINMIYSLPNKIFGINLYAVCILIGIIIAYAMGIKEGKRLGIKKTDIGLGVVIIVPISIIGARLWYVLFNLSSFKNFGEVLGFQDGKFVGLAGLAIQGGVIAALISIICYTHIKKISLYRILDIVAPGFLVGQICGRYGNFFNQELYGAKVINTTLFQYFFPSWITENMYINGAYRHPAFFYESSLNLLGLIVMLFLRRKSTKLKSGDLMGIYLVWYGFVRIITENIRLNSGVDEPLMIGNVSVSILMSILFILSGVVFLILKRHIKQMKSDYYQDIIENEANNNIDTVIFDLDGTLLNTKPLIDSTFTYVFQMYFPNHNLTDEELNSFFGPTLYDTFSKYESDPKKIDELIEVYRKYNKEHHDEFVKPFPNAKATLKTLHNKGYKVCVVSSKIKEMVEYGLEVNGMLKYVDYIIGEGEVIPKPNPCGILIAMDHFKFSKHGIYVGDAPTDIMAGANAQKYYQQYKETKTMKTCGVLYSTKVEKLKELEPNYLISGLENILDIVNE